MKVSISWNARAGHWSIRPLEGADKGKVAIKADQVLIESPRFLSWPDKTATITGVLRDWTGLKGDFKRGQLEGSTAARASRIISEGKTLKPHPKSGLFFYQHVTEPTAGLNQEWTVRDVAVSGALVAWLRKGHVHAMDLEPSSEPLCRAIPETLDRIRALADGKEFTLDGITVARSGELYHVGPEGEPKRGKSFASPNQAALRFREVRGREGNA